MGEIVLRKLVDLGCKLQSGFGFKSTDYLEVGIPLIKIGNIQNKIVTVAANGSFISENSLNDKMRNVLLHNNDVLIAMTGQGSVGRVGKLKLKSRQKALLNQRVGKFICDEVNLSKVFLYFILTTEKYQDYLFNAGAGSGQPNLSPNLILETKIPWVPYKVQVGIASVLSSLDDKIDLLHSQNKTLEALAETMFRQWFIEDAQEDWEYAELKKYVSIVDNRGKTPPNQTEYTRYPLIEVNALGKESRLVDYSVIRKYVDEETFSSWFRNSIQKFDTLISTVGSIGAMSMYIPNKGHIAQNVVGLRAINISPFYLFQILKYKKKEIHQLDIGGVQPSIKVPHLLSLIIPIPPTEKQKYFDNYLSQFVSKLEINYHQINTLETLRDELIPKLMSGKAKVRF